MNAPSGRHAVTQIRWGAAFALAIAGMSGCGGNDGPSDTDRTAIETLIVRHYKTPSCADLTTAGRKAFGHPAEDAACATDIKTQQPKDVSVSAVKVEGDSGSAVADDYTFTLQRVSGAWLIAG